jgi:hypothetical protein
VEVTGDWECKPDEEFRDLSSSPDIIRRKEMFQNMLLRRIFGPKRVEVTGD